MGLNGFVFVKINENQQEVGRKICKLNDEKRSTSYLLQSISIKIQHSSAASVMGTVYNNRNLKEIYNL